MEERNVHKPPSSENEPNTEQYAAGLTDFGPDRLRLFPNNTDAYLRCMTCMRADVTEGLRRVWERLQFDRSDLNHVFLKTIDLIGHRARLIQTARKTSYSRRTKKNGGDRSRRQGLQLWLEV